MGPTPEDKRSGRAIIFHAITKDGLLHCTDREVMQDVPLTEESPTAEYIYTIVPPKPPKKPSERLSESASTITDKKDDKELYHGNIDAEMWIAWLQRRLIPAFKATYHGYFTCPKMILCMDNASYHNPRDADWVPPEEMKKAEVGAALIKHGITSFSCLRSGRPLHFTQANYSRRAARGNDTVPSSKELKTELKDFYKKHQDLVITRTKRILHAEQWEILFTPPLEPECQPIERVWGMVKGVVAKMYRLGRTTEEMRRQLWHAFYTYTYGTKGEATEEVLTGGEGITAYQVQGSIQKSEKWMLRFVEEHPHLLQGTWNNLRYSEREIEELKQSAPLTAEEEEDDDAQIEDSSQEVLDQLEGDELERAEVTRVLLNMQAPGWTRAARPERDSSSDEEDSSDSPPLARRLDFTHTQLHMEVSGASHHRSVAGYLAHSPVTAPVSSHPLLGPLLSPALSALHSTKWSVIQSCASSICCRSVRVWCCWWMRFISVFSCGSSTR